VKLKFFKKIKKNGLAGSLKIAKDKFDFKKEEYLVKNGKYEFIKETVLLKNSINNLSLYLTQHEINVDDLKNKDDIYVEKERNHTFTFMGKEYEFGNKINWHFNSYDINKSYPFIFEKKINLYDYEKYGDYRITWELNRHHHFVWFAQNYCLTKDESIIRMLQNQWYDWIEKDKVGYGINFASPMEIAIRLFNWLVTLLILKNPYTRIKLEEDQKIINSILGQIFYLSNNLSYYDRKFRNNHSIVELSCLILVQSIFKLDEIAEPSELFDCLRKELENQFYTDGINFEHSPTYSRFTLESLLIMLIFFNGDKDAKDYILIYSLVKKYITALRAFLNPNNSVPLFSDSDNGRILFLNGSRKSFLDFKGFFDFCGLYYNENKLLTCEQMPHKFNHETKWWCAITNLQIDKNMKNTEMDTSILFPDGGYYIFKSAEIYMAFKSNYQGNKHLKVEYAPHVHNDLLSFELFYMGEPILVDSGTYTYNVKDDSYRDLFRSVYAHSTIIVNSNNQLRFNEHFGAKNLPNSDLRVNSDTSFEGTISLENNHLLLKRKIDITDSSINFNDVVEGDEIINHVEIVLNFYPTIGLEFKDTSSVYIKSGVIKLMLSVLSPSKFEIREEKGLYSNLYNQKFENKKLIIRWDEHSTKINCNWKLKMKGI
jgi:Heparinase II/III-like protein/Heparinase II/III N-terminus